MFILIFMIIGLRTALTVRLRPKFEKKTTDTAHGKDEFAVATFNIENAVKFSVLQKSNHSEQLGHLFEQMAKCSVIFLQEYTDESAWETLRQKFPEGGKHFELIDPSHASLVDTGSYDDTLPNAFRVAILYDTRYWLQKTANMFVLTKVDKLGFREGMVTHIKNRVALQAALSPIHDPDDEVNFINIHLDAVHTASHPNHHHEQLHRVLLDWIGIKLSSSRSSPTHSKINPKAVSKLKLVIGGDTNYRGGADGKLLENLVKGGDESTKAAFIALGLRDALKNATAVPTQRVQHVHEGGVAKVGGRLLAKMGVKVGPLAPKRLDLLATNLVVTNPQEVVDASAISDHNAVIGHFNTALWRYEK